MAASGAPVRQSRRGPAPIASFDHDVSDESSPETKQSFRLPEIREDASSSSQSVGVAVVEGATGESEGLAPPEQRARSHSTPAVGAGLHTAPRIDISRASSSSHHDSRDSSPELALFAGTGSEDGRGRLELGFREDGALDLRSSTEELAFLEPAPGELRAPAPPPPPPVERRHSRKDSQGSEAALLAVSGRTSRLSSVGSQCSAHSALSGFSHASRVSRLSVVSGASRSPSPHKMLLETSFCGPKPIETDPEICAAAVEERLLEIVKMSDEPLPPPPVPVDARDRREVRTEVTVEQARPPSAASHAAPTRTPTPALTPATTSATQPADPPPIAVDDDKRQKETRNRAKAEERRARPRVRREPSEPEVYKSGNQSKDIIRIKLKPDEDYEDEKESQRPSTSSASVEAVRKPESLQLKEAEARAVRPTELASSELSREGAARPTELATRTEPASPATSRRRALRDSRTPSPAGPSVSRKSSFCSLFKSRETIASPDSPSEALRRKRSLTEGRSRSKSRDRSSTPTSASKIRGSVLSLFRTPRRSATSPSPSSREGSPVVMQPQRPTGSASHPAERPRLGDKLKYYEESRDGIIHIPLRTPPDERPGPSTTTTEGRDSEADTATVNVTAPREPPRCASAPHARIAADPSPSVTVARVLPKPFHRTVLPDGSIIIPLRSPTERAFESDLPVIVSDPESTPKESRMEPAKVWVESPQRRDDADGAEASPERDRGDERKPEATEIISSVTLEASAAVDDGRRRRKERLVFTTHVGSREQVFSTQFSITKTPSVTSEISESFPSCGDGEVRPPTLRDTHITTDDTIDRTESTTGARGATPDQAAAVGPSAPSSPQEAPRDSSESEPSSETAQSRAGNDVERRGLVVQESFEEELPYVPTTLPQERSVALPMVPVRERGGVHVSGVERPRAAAPAPPTALRDPPRELPRDPPPDKLRIRLPRRPRTATAAPSSRTERMRTRSGGDGVESRVKPEWIDFEEVPERRKQPKRIQTLPASAAGVPVEAGAGGVVFSYVEPEHCRCECHGHARHEDQLPLLQDDMHHSRLGSSPLECGAEGGGEAPGALPGHPHPHLASNTRVLSDSPPGSVWQQ